MAIVFGQLLPPYAVRASPKEALCSRIGYDAPEVPEGIATLEVLASQFQRVYDRGRRTCHGTQYSTLCFLISIGHQWGDNME